MKTAARVLAGALEPVVGQVYFAPECHVACEALGFGGSPGSFAGVAGPDGPAYFCSRGSVMGQVPGHIGWPSAVFDEAADSPDATAEEMCTPTSRSSDDGSG